MLQVLSLKLLLLKLESAICNLNLQDHAISTELVQCLLSRLKQLLQHTWKHYAERALHLGRFSGCFSDLLGSCNWLAVCAFSMLAPSSEALPSMP
jgi:hypothetical protein